MEKERSSTVSEEYRLQLAALAEQLVTPERYGHELGAQAVANVIVLRHFDVIPDLIA